MATVSDLLRGVSTDFVVHAGAAGLGREVRRVLLLQPPTESASAIGRDDLVVYALAIGGVAGEDADQRAILSLLSAGAAGVLTDAVPSVQALQDADKRGSPLVAAPPSVGPDQLHMLLVQALEHHQVSLGMLQTELQCEFSRLARVGASPALLIERLVEVTGKTGLLQGTLTGIEVIQQPVLQDLAANVIRRAIETTDIAAQRWMLETADATVANVLYLEVAASRLVRLIAPIWIEGHVRAAVSLLARSDELGGRDRVALVAAARALSGVYIRDAYGPISAAAHGPFGAVVLRTQDASVERLAASASQCFGEPPATLSVGRDDVRAWLPYQSQATWRRQIGEWHARLSEDLGIVSLGHSVRTAAESDDAQRALVQAAEAALLGDRLFGPGHITSYPDAQLARFLLDNRQTHELRTLYERAIGKLAAEDLKRDGELVNTLDAYCETLSTQGAAERVGVHRNTVLYRLKLIEEITGVDLDDGSMRLFLQLGLLAGRLARRTSGGRLNALANLDGRHLMKAGRRPALSRKT